MSSGLPTRSSRPISWPSPNRRGVPLGCPRGRRSRSADPTPYEAVTVGAALYANSFEDDTDLRVQLLDVIPMAIGLEAAGEQMHVVFPRNAAIPNAKQIAATTSFDGQKEVVVRIYQGDQKDVLGNELLGEFTFGGLAGGPAGSARMEITFDVNIEGILKASARDLASGREMTTTVRLSALER